MGYYGAEFLPTLRGLVLEDQKDLLIHLSFPSPLVTLLGLRRVTFPEYNLGCTEGDTGTPEGGVDCDFPFDFVKKVARADLKNYAPRAIFFIQKFMVLHRD